MTDEESKRLTEGVRWALNRMSGTKLHKAARLSVSLSTIDRWFAGASLPTEENLARIARLAGTDQETVRDGGEMPKTWEDVKVTR